MTVAEEAEAGSVLPCESPCPALPQLNMKGRISADQRKRHPNAPERCQWTSGVLLPADVPLKNGTFGPRYSW